MEAPFSRPPQSPTLLAESTDLPSRRWLLSNSPHVSISGDASSTGRNWLIAMSILASIILVGLVAYPYDMLLSKWICTVAELPGDLRRVLALSELIAHGSGVVILLVAVWRLAPHLRYYLPRVACSGLLAGLVANLLKLVHARFRPLTCPPDIETVERTWRGWFPATMDLQGQPYGYVYQSFPSAHTATAVGFAIGLAWLFPRGRVLFFVVALMAGLQRIAFRAHWPSDVLFGAAVGVLIGSCFTLRGTLGYRLFDRLERYWIFTGKTPIQKIDASTDEESADENDDQPSRRAA